MLVQIKGQVLFKGKIITKMQKCGRVIQKSSSQEPQSHRSPFFKESVLI
jgi:hypothetical protein